MTTDYKKDLVSAYNYDASRRSVNSSVEVEWKLKQRTGTMKFLAEEGASSLLEIGAGTGQDSLFFRDHGFEMTAIDLSEEMIKYCVEKGLNAKVMDFYQLEFPDGSFDAIYAMNCLLHVPKVDIDKVLVEIKRVLKPSGLFYMGLYGGSNSEGIWEDDWCDPPRFFAFYTDEAIQSVVKKHFELVDFKTVPLEQDKPHFQSIILRKGVSNGIQK
jgi:ubiquinone/menaquinone biosynthesis C-methylase UbiE